MTNIFKTVQDKFDKVWSSKHNEFIRVPSAWKNNFTIALLEADVEHTIKQLEPVEEAYETDISLGIEYGGSVAWNTALESARDKIVTYKQQAIDELKQLSN